MSEHEWPYRLPIWRSSHRACSPNGQFVAEIDPAYEVSMGNPTSGVLRLSAGLELERCSPSFIWSDDSRYLVVPEFVNRLGVFRRSRVVIIDTLDRRALGSLKTAWYYQPESFLEGLLVVIRAPFRSAQRVEWRFPEDCAQFKTIRAEWKEAVQPAVATDGPSARR